MSWEDVAENGYRTALELGVGFSPRWVEVDVTPPEEAWCAEEDDARAETQEKAEGDEDLSDIDPDTHYADVPEKTSEADEPA